MTGLTIRTAQLCRFVPARCHCITHTIHSSGPNRSDDYRIGYAVSFIPAHVRPQTEPRTSVLCVRGADRYGHFVHEERLKTPLSNAARAAHTEAYRRYTAATGIAT